MYLARMSNTIEVQAPFYINIIEKIIEEKDLTGKTSIDSAIMEAKEVAEETKDIYSINNRYYFFITTLLKSYKEGLFQLDKNNITESNYKDILDILK